MPLKNRHHTTESAKNTSSDRKNRQKQGVVDAVIFQSKPDVSFYLSLFNLLNFFVDCINQISVATDVTPQRADHLTRSVSAVRQLYDNHSSGLNDELRRFFSEFLEESDDFSDMIQVLAATEQNLHMVHNTTMSKIIANISRLQWLSVCIMQEMKQFYLHT